MRKDVYTPCSGSKATGRLVGALARYLRALYFGDEGVRNFLERYEREDDLSTQFFGSFVSSDSLYNSDTTCSELGAMFREMASGEEGDDERFTKSLQGIFNWVEISKGFGMRMLRNFLFWFLFVCLV
jgi:hypothetical protein